LGAAPRVLVWDGEGAVGRWRGRRIELTQACQEFRGTLAAKVQICKPADPEAKGLVERLHDYLERSFLPGRTFASPADFNQQLGGFLARANQRQHRALGCRPVDRLDGDRQAMLALPMVPPVTGWRMATRLPRDHYLRLDGNDYSVHPATIGRRVELQADLHQVRVWSLGHWTQTTSPSFTTGWLWVPGRISGRPRTGGLAPSQSDRPGPGRWQLRTAQRRPGQDRGPRAGSRATGRG
jgi:transposase